MADRFLITHWCGVPHKYVRHADGTEETFPCDSVVLAAGMRSRSDEVERLRPLVNTFYVVGDARQARNVMMAVRDGYDAVVNVGL